MPNPSEEDKEIFLNIRKAYETLNDPIKRNAYDLFGVEALECSYCRTHKDYFYDNAMSSIGWYLGYGIIMVIMNVVGNGQYGRYWRFTSFVAMAFLELGLLTGATRIPLWPLTSGEFVVLMHENYIYLSIALSQIGPYLFPTEPSSSRRMIRELDLLYSYCLKGTEEKLVRVFEPFLKDGMKDTLFRRIQKLTVDRRLFELDPEYRKLHLTTENGKRQVVTPKNK